MNPKDTFYNRKAREKERSFFSNRGRAGSTVYTIKTGRINTIQKETEKYVYVRSENGSADNRISRDSIRRALALLFYRRVITLKALIKIKAYSSAMAAIIKAIMVDICKVVKTKSGAVRLTLRGLRYIFSGLSKSRRDIELVKEYGGRFILLNYFTIRNDHTNQWKQTIIELGFDYKCVIIDPGEKTLHDAAKKGLPVKPIDIDDYAAFVRQHSDIIYQYLTLDIIGDPAATQRNTKYLALKVGRKPVPIYHIQSDMAALQELVDEEHELIAIGGSALRSVSTQRRERVFDEIFRKYGDSVNFHALGLGSLNLLLKYSWFSADASSWLNARIFGKLQTLTGQSVVPPYMSSEAALGFNVNLLVSLEERYYDLQTTIDMFV
ncbi:hypothetical protein [Paenibacillus sp. 1A_MP2]|uniref:hypothetical protein n=1 Tax=Paenibacillus sp. 1A_MP2 TaxID=3457495 RepID=UPI003FCD7854